LFEAEGYSTVDDVESLKGLTEKDLQDIGITRRGNNGTIEIVNLNSHNFDLKSVSNLSKP